jgi:putative ABC transport system ATP-binding protein
MDRKTAAALASRAEGVRAGVDIGFADAAFSQALRQARAGVWMTVEDGVAARDAAAAALDPKTAEKVLRLTEKIVTGEKLTTLMITHNMRDALRYGNRLLMMHEGRIVVDVSDEEKKSLTVPDLLKLFEKNAGTVSDSTLLSS